MGGKEEADAIRKRAFPPHKGKNQLGKKRKNKTKGGDKREFKGGGEGGKSF